MVVMFADGWTEARDTVYYPVIAHTMHDEDCPARALYNPRFFKVPQDSDDDD